MGTEILVSDPPDDLSRPDETGRSRPRWCSNRSAVVGVTVLTALIAAAYLAIELKRYYSFQDSADLVYFDQAVRSYAHFHPGISVLYGRYTFHSSGTSVLGDHFSPILATLAPLYWIYDSPRTLLAEQAALYALAIPPLWVFARRAMGSGSVATFGAYVVAITYAVSWPVGSAISFNFHETAFAPVLMAVTLERLQAGRLRGALLALGALLLVKEDMGLFAAGVGMYLAVARPALVSRQRLVALGLVVTGVGYSWIATRIAIPAFGGNSSKYWAYPTFGRDVPAALLHIIEHPVSSATVLVTPGIKVGTTLWLLGAFCFLSLLSPITIAALPLLIERMLGTTREIWWIPAFHYNAYVVVVLLCGAVDGAVRLDRWARLALRRAGPAGARALKIFAPGTLALACACAMAVVGVNLISQFSLNSILLPKFYRQQQSPGVRAQAAAVAVIPPGVTVETVPSIGPALSARDTVEFWNSAGPLWAPWVVAQVTAPQFTFGSVLMQQDRVTLLEQDGYRLVFQRQGFVVLHRAGQGAAGPG